MLQIVGITCREIIDDMDPIPPLDMVVREMASDKTRSAGDQYRGHERRLRAGLLPAVPFKCHEFEIKGKDISQRPQNDFDGPEGRLA